MPNILIGYVENSIPLDSMPLNKNFTSIESREKSFETYEGHLDPKELAKLGFFYYRGRYSILLCFNCGNLTLLTKDHETYDGLIYHSENCSIISNCTPSSECSEDKKISENDSESIVTTSKDAKLDTGQHEEQINNNDLPSVDVYEDKKQVKEIETENDVKDEDEDSEDYPTLEEMEAEGTFWYCFMCGKDEHVKIINMPCGHQTSCLSCIKSTENKCCFCSEKVIFYLRHFVVKV